MRQKMTADEVAEAKHAVSAGDSSEADWITEWGAKVFAHIAALKPGDVLVKLKGGGRRRVKVLRVGRLSAILEDLGATNRKRTNAMQTHAVNLGPDGLPEGYRREET